MSTYHLRLEAVNLSTFVYDTNQLSAVRGGGLLLLRATTDVQARFPALEPITTGASAGIFEFHASDDAAAARARDDVDAFLRTDATLRHATFVVDVTRGGDYAAGRETLLALNRWRQWRRPTVAFPAPPARDNGVCRVDGVRPAGDRPIRKGSDPPLPASASVHLRWEYGRDEKHTFYRHEAGLAATFTNDFDELARDDRRGNLDGKLAVVYADGNAFGAIQRRHCTTTAEQRHFDDYLKGRRKAWLTAFLEHAKPVDSGFHTHDGRLRIETLLWGGDEILLVVPAWRGWWTLAHFFEHSAKWEIFDEPLTHAAGLVFCHHNAPIRRVKALAEALANSVKNSEGGRKTSRFAYQVLESFDHVGVDLDEFRKRRWARPGELILPAEGMQDVADHVRALDRAEFPRSKLHAIARKLAGSAGDNTEDRARAERWIQQALLARPKSREPVDKLRAYFGGEHDSAVTWLHVAELWDYLTAV